jgi:chemotaxis family two-component system response regulator PixG
MATQEVATTTELAKHIHACSEEKFTGQLDLEIKDPKGQRWSLYFHLGGLIWATSDLHPMRRLHRQLSQQSLQLSVYSEALGSLQSSAVAQGSVQPQCWDYNCLAELVRQGKVGRWQMAAIIEGNITEILFDIYQSWDQLRYRSALQLTYRRIPEDTKDPTLVVIQVDQPWKQAKQAWEAWQQAGFVDYSPNQAPVIWQAEKLQQQTSPLAYYNLIALVDGKRTFRDLAVNLKQNLLPVTQSIMPYIRKGLIEVIQVGDLSYSGKPVTGTNPQPAPVATPVSPVQTQATGPLVACIDDSRIDSETMSQILTQAGYRCINVQDPVKALPILLEHKPGLIFLDLVMPVANGYEICGQIRRVSVFKDTPVIILTSNDGIVDRVRAKMVGSSGFLAKPIERSKVLAILQRYLPTPTPAPSQRLPTVRTWSPNQQV